MGQLRDAPSVLFTSEQLWAALPLWPLFYYCNHVGCFSYFKHSVLKHTKKNPEYALLKQGCILFARGFYMPSNMVINIEHCHHYHPKSYYINSKLTVTIDDIRHKNEPIGVLPCLCQRLQCVGRQPAGIRCLRCTFIYRDSSSDLNCWSDNVWIIKKKDF